MNSLTGTTALIRLIIRRDRLRLPIWIVGIVAFFILVAVSFPDIYPTAEERQARAALMENPTAMAFRGPGHGLENYTYGAMLANELMNFAAIAVALMSIFLVVRHTRAEEESGRLELVRAAIVGRYASPVAALIVVGGANLAIAGLLTLLLTGLTDVYSFTGSLAFGLAVASVGLVFAGIAAVTVQLTEYGRGASSMAALMLGVAFMFRAVGDVQGSALSWLSPIGWAQATRAFVDERWWPLLLSIGFMAGLVVLAFALINRRDVGAGLMPSKPGPPQASNLISHPIGFAFRQQRGSLIGWATGLVVLGVAFGSLIGDVEEFVSDVEGLEDFLGATGGDALVDSFLALLALVMALLTTGFAIQSALRVRTEETAGRAESVLSTAVPRVNWLASYLIVAMLGSAAILLAGGLSLGITTAIDQSDFGRLTGVLGAALVYVPVIWLIIGIAAATFGLFPRIGAVPWLILIYGLFVGLFGGMVQLPGWMFDLSPYERVPELPGGEFTIIPVTIIAILAIGLIGLGLAGFRRRDVYTN